MGTSYLVCATPRSGSTLLCEGLTATGVAGRPQEYFEAVAATGRPPQPQDYLEGLDDRGVLDLLGGAAPPELPAHSSLAGIGSYADHLQRVRDWGTTPNGVFGAKLMWDHVGELQALVADRAPLDLLTDLFREPRYVWVRRGDVVRQAVSLWRAMQSQSWRDDSAHGTSSGRGVQPRYSFPALRHLVARVVDHDTRWGALLAASGSPVLEMTYEELTGDLPGTLERTLRHLGVRLPADWPPRLPTMRRQADELSEAWAAAFARDAAADPAHDSLPSPT